MIMPLTLSLARHCPADALLRTALPAARGPLPAARGRRPCRSPWRLKEGTAPPSWCGTPLPGGSVGGAWMSSTLLRPLLAFLLQPASGMDGRDRGRVSPSHPLLVAAGIHTPAVIRMTGPQQGSGRSSEHWKPPPQGQHCQGPERHWAWAGNGRAGRGLPRRVDLSFLHLAQQNPATSWPSPSPGEQHTSPPALRPGQHTSTHLQVPGGPWRANWLGSGAIKGGEGRGSP